MRTIAAGLATHLATDAHTRCAMLRLDLADGSILAFTDHDAALTFNLGDGDIDYLPDTGILPSDLALSTGFTADDMEVSGPIGDVVTRTAVIGGRFDDAIVRYFQVNWSDLTQGAAKLVKGRVVLAEVEAGKFKFTVHSEISKFSQTVGRTITAYCENDYGDGHCGKTPVTAAATVTAVTDERAFTVSFAGSHVDDFFNMGTVTFLTGELAGCRPVEIFDWSAGGAIALWTPLPEPPQVGDTLTVKEGCGKTRQDCVDKDGDATPFRGFPDVPGTDQVLRYPNPQGG